MQVDRGDPLRDEEPVGIRTREEHELAALLAARAAVAGAARRRVRSDHPPALDETAELVSERRRRLLQEQWVAAAERLQVGAVGERHLDLDEHVTRSGLRLRHLLDPQIAGGVEARSLHGLKTTFSASPRR